MAHTPYIFHRATGAAAIASTLAPDVNFVLIAIKLTFDAAVGAEDFTATVDSGVAGAYDHILLTQDMNGLTNFTQLYGAAGVPFQRGDEIDFAFANSTTKTYGLEVVYREEA